MCGIAAIFGRQPVSMQALKVMTDLMAHRGPDGEGAWRSQDGQAAIGHRRLAIIGGSENGVQPMADAEGRFVLTYNGEIYNYKEIAQELEARGVSCNPASDTEVLFQALAHWGREALPRLNGMFSFAFFDVRSQTVLCARDRFGEKPFLFHLRPGLFALASEYKPLLALDEVSSGIDQDRLRLFLKDGRIGLDGGDGTLFPAIEHLGAGECLFVDLSTFTAHRERYWTVEQVPSQKSRLDSREVGEELARLASDAVRLRLRSDVPLGSCLSGGLDSTFIVGLARRLVGDAAAYHAFHGSFPGAEVDERERAEAVAGDADITLHVCDPSAEHLADILPEFIYMNELPVSGMSQFAQWSVFADAKRHGVTVLLDGQGADEVLAGYEQYFGAYLQSLDDQGDQTTASTERAIVLDRYPLALATQGQRIKRALPPSIKRGLATALDRGSDIGLAFDTALTISPDQVAGGKAWTDEPRSRLHDALLEDALEASLPSLLRYGDRNSMAHSREVRLPFCDHRIIEFAMALPVSNLMGGGQTKRVLRDAMEGVVRDDVRLRWRKQGFRPPQAAWLRKGRLREALADCLGSRTFSERGFWRTGWLRKAHARFEAGDDTLSDLLWKVLITENWFENFLAPISNGPRCSAFASAE